MHTLMQIADFASRLISLYSFFIWVRIFLSWINPYPREGSITWYFARMVDPYLNLFRSRKFHVGILDFSPLFAIAVLSVGQSLLSIFAAYGTLRLSWCLQLLLQALWSYGVQVFLMISIIMLVIRTIGAFTHSPAFSRMSVITDPLVRKVQYLFFPKRIVKETTLCLLTLAILLLCYFGIRYIFAILITLTYRIPF